MLPPFIQQMSEAEARLRAETFAQQALDAQHTIKQDDRPYIRHLLTEAILFERPLRKLDFSFMIKDTILYITIKGYQKGWDSTEWNELTKGPERHEYMPQVIRTYVQGLDDHGFRICVLVKPLEYVKVPDDDEVHKRRRVSNKRASLIE